MPIIGFLLAVLAGAVASVVWAEDHDNCAGLAGSGTAIDDEYASHALMVGLRWSLGGHD